MNRAYYFSTFCEPFFSITKFLIRGKRAQDAHPPDKYIVRFDPQVQVVGRFVALSAVFPTEGVLDMKAKEGLIHLIVDVRQLCTINIGHPP